MTNLFADAIGGLGGGAAVAMLGLGLVLTFRAAGVLNLAHAATGAYLAFAYFEFREGGDLVLPVLGLPARVHLLATPTQATALVVLLLLAALLGTLLHLLVFRPLRDSPPVARMVATLGIFLYVGEIIRLRFPIAGSAVTRRLPVLPQGSVRLLGTSVGTDRLWLAAFAVVGAGLLTAMSRHTRFGLVTRAVAASDKGALLIGLRPDVVAIGNWALATMLGGLAVVLIQPLAGLDATTTSLLVVPALAAALLGGLTSFWITTGAGLAIGALQGVILGYLVRPGTTWVPRWLPVNGVVQAVPVVLILVALAWRGDVVPGRTAIAPRRFAPSPTPRHPSIVVAVVSVAGFVAALTFDAAHRQALVVSLIATVLGLSVVVVTGYAGLISLAPLAIAGVSGFTLVHLADAGVPFPLDLLIATAVGCVAGLAMGASASRLRGTTFAVATLALAVAVEQLVLASTSFSGGTAGRAAPRPHLAGIDLGAAARGADDVRRPFVVLLVVVLAIVLTLVVNLRRSHTGLRWLALRANERAAAAVGIDVARAKLTAMGTSSALAGLAGGLTAYATSTLSPASFMVIGALVVVALTFLGGISSVWGAVIGGLLAQSGLITTLGNGGRTSSGDLTSAIAGLVLVAAASLAPDGVAGRTRALASRIHGRLAGATR